MRIRLLGPLEVTSQDGACVTVNAPMLRALLAGLTLRTGQAVPAGELAAQLWGDNQPVSAATTLRNYVMRLRKVLPGGYLRTESGGYQLALRESDTDLGTFRNLVRCADAARSADTALVLLDEALDLWRGQPLEDIGACPLRTTEGARLSELRLTAVEERFALKNSLGHHAEIIDELSVLVRSHGLRERLVQQLMIALHRSGRTTDALHLYQSVSDRLDEELGLEPGDALRRLHHTIRNSRPAATTPGTGRDTAHGPPGRGTPPLPAALTPTQEILGRDRELALLRTLLTEPRTTPAICLVDGPAGVGKSALVRRAAHDAVEHHPGGALYLDLHGDDPRTPPRDPDSAVRDALAALGVRGEHVPADPEAAAALYRERLGDRRVLLVLDNVRDAAQVRPLVPPRNVSLLVTSRAVLPLPSGGHHLHLGPLAPEYAVRLLRSVREAHTDHARSMERTGADVTHQCAPAEGVMAPGEATPQATGEPDDWAELARLCEYRPLALRVLGLRMADRPHWDAAAWRTALRSDRGLAGHLRAGELDLRASLMVSIDRLARGHQLDDRHAARLFPWLGVSRIRSHTPRTLAALSGLPERDAERALERLTDARVTESPRPGRYALGGLMWSVAAQEAVRLPIAETGAGLLRLADWYLGSLYRMNQRLAIHDLHRLRMDRGATHHPSGRSFASAEEALAWADESRDAIAALAEQLADPSHDDEALLVDGRPASAFCLDVALALDPYWAVRHDLDGLEHLSRVLDAVAERRRDAFAMAVAQAQLGRVARFRARPEEALSLLERASAHFAALGDRASATVAVSDAMDALISCGRPREAVRRGEAALALAREMGGVDALVDLLRQLARGYLALGAEALCWSAAIDSYRQAGSAYQRSRSAVVLAEYHAYRGEYAEASHWAELGVAHTLEHPCDPTTVATLRDVLRTARDGPDGVAEARVRVTRRHTTAPDRGPKSVPPPSGNVAGGGGTHASPWPIRE